ncbi:MAG TPA: RHS repeat-associated core domain-containing protein, partial [Thermoanaerobaculia bacterium]
ACSAPSPRTVSFSYNQDLLSAVGVPGNPGSYASSIAYHPNLMVNQVVHGNGQTDAYANDPNSMRRPGSITVTSSAGAQLWATGAYGYDGAGNVKAIGTHTFAYDKVSRLKSANLYLEPTGSATLRTQAYTYDAFGNIQSIGGSSARNTPTSSATNRLTSGGYDAAGNLTSWNGNTYRYDPFNLMWDYKTPADEWVYLYTADDERAWTFKIGGGSLWTLRGPDGKVLREYSAGASWKVESDYVYRDGSLLAAETPQGTRHFSLDHLGTPRLHVLTAQGHADVWTGTGAGCIPAPADYDGDGNTDFSLKCGPAWHFYNDDGTYLKGIWTGGSNSDVPVPADYDGDGDDDPVAFNGGAWQFYDYATGAYHGVWTGTSAGCIPAPADYDGDGNADLSLKCGPVWHFYNDNGTYLKGIWTGGTDSDVPVPGDYNGDGKEKPAVFNGGAWIFYDYTTGAATGVWLGFSGTPMPMDYDGDGTKDLTVYANGAWHFFYDDGTHKEGIWTGGVAEDKPVTGDYTGGGRDEPVIFRNGAWLFFDSLLASTTYHVYYPFGEEATTFNQDMIRAKFTGHERDLNAMVGANPPADDLDYMVARHCSPLTGRFLSVDPALESADPFESQSWNRYSYVRSNPLLFVDPKGEVLRFFGSQRNLDKLQEIVNASLIGLKLMIDKNGFATLVSTGVAGPPTQQQAALAAVLGSAINAKGTVSMRVASSDSDVLIGEYVSGRIDIRDIAAGGAEGPANSASLLAHEVAEQAMRQVLGLGNTKAEYDFAHSVGRAVQEGVSGYAPGEQSKFMIFKTGLTVAPHSRGKNIVTVTMVWINGNLSKVIRR